MKALTEKQRKQAIEYAEATIEWWAKASAAEQLRRPRSELVIAQALLDSRPRVWFSHVPSEDSWKTLKEVVLSVESYEGLREVFEAARKAVGLREGCRYDDVVQGIQTLHECLDAALDREAGTADALDEHLRRKT